MSEYAKVTITALICVALICVAVSASNYEIEEAKSRAIIAKACIESGGDWSLGWAGNKPSCTKRTKP